VRKIEDIECFLLDMDGTLYLGDKLIEGAWEFLQILEEQGKQAIFLTNNSSKNKYNYHRKLAKMGIKADPENIFTSGEATAIYINKEKPGAKIFLLGTPLLEEEFKFWGFELVHETTPDYVVLGFDTTLTYEKLWKACDFIRQGVKFIATHPDYNCPIGAGKYMPDTGAMIKFIEASTGKTPLTIGKPSPYIVESLREKYQISHDSMAMVGDRLYTDIELGCKTGLTTVLVLSGETSLEQYRTSKVQATYVFSSVKELGQTLLEAE